MNMKKRILLAVMLFLGIFGLVSCSFEAVTSISLESGFKQEWTIGEELDKASLKIIATLDGGTTQELNGNTAGVSISGFDTKTAGEKTLTIQYEGVSVSASYLVIDVENLAKNSTELKAMIDQGIDVISLKPGVVYDLNGQPISSSVAIRTYGSAAAGKAILKNVYVNYAQIKTSEGVIKDFAQSITFSNIKFTNNGGSVLSDAALLKVVGGTKEQLKDKIQFSNCEFEAKGVVATGLRMSGNLDYKFLSCNFVTPEKEDRFDTMVNLSGVLNRSKENNIINGCNITCRFAYAFQGICGTSFIGNTVKSTLVYEDFYLDSSNANLVKLDKNPVLFHSETSYNEGKLDLFISDNEISNLENLFRIYHTDDSKETVSEGLTFSNNNLSNIAVLVNYSTAAYSKDFAHQIVTQNATMKNGHPLTEAYTKEISFVIKQGTKLTQEGERTVTFVDEGAIYTGLVYQEKYTTDLEHKYNYVANLNSKYYLKQGTNFYTITIVYSADGLDSRTITLVEDAAIIEKLEGYLK